MTKLLALVVALLLGLTAFQWGRAEQALRRAKTFETQLSAETQARKDEASARLTESKRAHRIQEALDAEHLAR